MIERKGVQITFGEPDSNLFAVPAWPERAPSEVVAILEKRFGLTNPHSGSVSTREMDSAYWARQARRP